MENYSDALKDVFNSIKKSIQNEQNVKTVVFNCSKCDKGFSQLQYMKAHERQIHTYSSDVNCEICHRTFRRKAALAKHKRLKHTNQWTLFKCSLCDFSSQHKNSLNSHMSVHNRGLYCWICKHFFEKSKIDSHKEEAHGKCIKTNEYKCSVCDYSSKDHSGLKSHISHRHSNNDPDKRCRICKKYYKKSEIIFHKEEMHTKCDICDINLGSSRNLAKHMKIHSTNKDIECEVCGKLFHYRGLYTGHYNQVHNLNKKQFKCDICQKTFSKNHVLQRHYLIHTNTEKMKCSECGKLISKLNLKNHLNTVHNNFKEREVCQLCAKEFSNKSHLERHHKIHSGDNEKPYKCDQCGIAFRENYNLKVHIKKIHITLNKNYSCNQCNKSFEYENDVKRHMKKTHNHQRKIQKCSKCEKSYFILKSLKRHMKEVHIEDCDQ